MQLSELQEERFLLLFFSWSLRGMGLLENTNSSSSEGSRSLTTSKKNPAVDDAKHSVPMAAKLLGLADFVTTSPPRGQSVCRQILQTRRLPECQSEWNQETPDLVPVLQVPAIQEQEGHWPTKLIRGGKLGVTGYDFRGRRQR